MSLFGYEIKKMFFHQKGLLLIGLFFFCSVVTLIVFDTPKNPDVEMNASQYAYYLNQVAGPHSDETEQLLTNESKQITDARVALEKAYDDYYDGNISKDKLLTVSGPLEGILNNERGFKLIFDQYTYIRENPDNRYFLSTNGWDGLLSIDRLDLLFLLLLLVLVTPVFCSEYTSEMDSLHLTMRKGTRGHAASKVALVLITVIVLSLLTALLRYGFFHIKYGLEHGNYPLQSLAYFGTSTKNISLLSTFVLITMIKIVGNLYFAMLIMLISVWTKKYALTLFSSTAVILLPYYGFNTESAKYLFPGPLGFMISTGFFKGREHEYNIITEQMDVIFEEISMLSIILLLVISLCISIGAFIIILVRHTNVWGTRKRRQWIQSSRMMLVLCMIVASLAGCHFNDEAEKGDIYNTASRHSFENERYRIFFDETDLDDRKLLFEDKQTGEINNFIRNPIQSLTKIEEPIYGNGSLVYYMKWDVEKSGFRDLEEPDRLSIIEVDTTSFDEKIIFERNINTEKNSFLGLHTLETADSLSFWMIPYFFLDKANIYFIDEGNQMIRQVNKRTGKTTVTNSSPLSSDVSVAFDGRNIYYLTQKYQIVKYDTKKGEETVLPDIITTYFMLTDTELLYVNRKDQYKIYALDLENGTTRKITDKSVWDGFTYDDQHIYYESRQNKEYRIDRNGEGEILMGDESD